MTKKYPKFIIKQYYVQAIDLSEHRFWMIAILSKTDDLYYAKRRAREYHRDFPTSIVRVWGTDEDKVMLLLPEHLLGD